MPFLTEFTGSSRYFNPGHHFYQQRYHHQLEDDEFSKSVTVQYLLELKGIDKESPELQSLLARAYLAGHLQTKLIQLSSGQRKKLQLVLSLVNAQQIVLLRFTTRRSRRAKPE